MKILMIVHRFHPNLFYPVKALKDAGHEVVMFVPDIEAYRTLSEDHSMLRPITVSEREMSVVYIYRLLKKHKPDLLLQRHFEGRWKLFSLISLLMGVKRVMYDQSTHTGNSMMKQYSRPFRRLTRTFMLDKFTPVLNLGRKGKYTEPFSHYIPFPIEPADNPELRDYSPARTIRFLTVGKLGQRRKNHIQIIDALEEINIDCSLTIVGAGNSFVFSEKKYYGELLSRVKATKINGGVTLLSDIPYTEMNRIYANHDIFILAAEDESLGQAILEAMAHGCPVIVSDSCGASGYVQDGINGLIFECNNVNDLIIQIKSLVNDPSLLRKFSDSAINIVTQVHSPHIFVKRIESLIR